MRAAGQTRGAHSTAPAMSGVLMLVPLIVVWAQFVEGAGPISQWFAAPAAFAAPPGCAAGDTPAHAEITSWPGATMSGLKRESKVGPLLEKAARLPGDGRAASCAAVSEQGRSQQAKQRPAAFAAAQHSLLVHARGLFRQQLGGFDMSSQNTLGSTYAASAANCSAPVCTAPTARQFLQVAGAPT